jgi:diamine N-acetyltransferase
MILLHGDRVRLRAIEKTDLDLLYAWENDPELWMVSNTSAPFSRHVLEQYLEHARQDIYEAKQLRMMIDQLEVVQHSGRTIGTIDLFDFDPRHQRAGIGILINGIENRRKGYASESLELIMDYARKVLHLHQLYCNIPSGNKASLNLFRKYGFRDTGLKKDWIRGDNGWIDVHLLQKLLKEAH